MEYNNKLNNKLNEYFLTQLGMFEYRRGWLKGNCPSCGKIAKFGVNIARAKTNCFICGYDEKPHEVVMTLENLQTQTQLNNFLKVFEGISFLQAYVPPKKSIPMILPESFKLLLFGESRIANLARARMESRGFNTRDLSRMGVGYCSSGPYALHIIIPFFQKGKLIYFNARNMVETGPKFKNPSEEEYGIGKNFLIYNIDALAVYKLIYIVESAINAMTLGDQAIALSGKTISDYQLNQILASPVEKVVILLDDDAWEWAIALALKLVVYKQVKLIKMPYKKDVNDLGRAATLKRVKSTEYSSFPEILKLKLENI